jgi:hypothetical protein
MGVVDAMARAPHYDEGRFRSAVWRVVQRRARSSFAHYAFGITRASQSVTIPITASSRPP